MPFKYPDGTNIPKSRVPYESYPTSIAGANVSEKPVLTNYTNRFINELNGYLDYNKPIRFFLIGVFGSGKSFFLNLIGKEIKNRNGIFIPIKFHKPKFFSTEKQTENYKQVLIYIVKEIGRQLVENEDINQQQFNKVIGNYGIDNIDECIIQLIKKSPKSDRVVIAFDEIEVLFASEGLNLRISDFISGFLHNLSESFRERPNWGICASITQDWHTQILNQAPQIRRARFEFKELQPLKLSEVRTWIETKNVRIQVGDS